MGRNKHKTIEYRKYELSTSFPIFLLSGNIWRISDIRSENLHFHNCLEIGICEEGSGTLEFLDTETSFNEGDVSIIASDIVHTTYSTKGTHSKWSYLFIDEEYLCGSFFPLDFVSNAEAISNLLHHFYAVYSKDAHPEIYQLTTMIIEEMLHKRTNYQFTVRGLFFSMLLKIVNLSGESREGRAYGLESSKKSLVIAPALDYMREHYMKNFSIDALAELCSMSITHFRRIFTDIMGTNPLDYLNRMRIKNAANLLRTSEMPIVEISEEVGFRSLSSFNRHFYTIMQTTPSLWRKEMSCVQTHSISKYPGWLIPPKEPERTLKS